MNAETRKQTWVTGARPEQSSPTLNAFRKPDPFKKLRPTLAHKAQQHQPPHKMWWSDLSVVDIALNSATQI